MIKKTLSDGKKERENFSHGQRPPPPTLAAPGPSCDLIWLGGLTVAPEGTKIHEKKNNHKENFGASPGGQRSWCWLLACLIVGSAGLLDQTGGSEERENQGPPRWNPGRSTGTHAEEIQGHQGLPTHLEGRHHRLQDQGPCPCPAPCPRDPGVLPETLNLLCTFFRGPSTATSTRLSPPPGTTSGGTTEDIMKTLQGPFSPKAAVPDNIPGWTLKTQTTVQVPRCSTVTALYDRPTTAPTRFSSSGLKRW